MMLEPRTVASDGADTPSGTGHHHVLPQRWATTAVLLIAVALVAVLSIGLAASPSEDVETRSNGGPDDNSYMDSASYNGSADCGICHIDAHSAWQDTLHPKKLQLPSTKTILGDWEMDPILDLGGGVMVTVDLSRDGQDFMVDLDGTGTSVFKVEYVLGAGAWDQRYLTTIGQSRYVLPIQWNVATEEWVGYEVSEWYDDEGTPKTVAKEMSWDLRCAGCHVTGFEIDYDEGTGEWVASFEEIGIGCEACHGPGSLHINPPEGRSRTEFIWSTVDSQVCGACHNRGASVGKVGGVSAGYPLDVSGNPYMPGDDLGDLFDSQRILYPDGETSAVHRQQYPDYVEHPHADSLNTIIQSDRGQETCLKCHSTDYRLAEDEDKPSLDSVEFNIECVACHGPHGTKNQHDLRVPREQVCSQCHKTFDSPPGETVHHPQTEMVGGLIPISGLGGSPWMGGEAVCEDCHMPLIATSGVGNDIASHSFYFVSPAKSLANGMPNSCNLECHGPATPGATLTDLEALQHIEAWRDETESLLPSAEASVEAAWAAIQTAESFGFSQGTIEDMLDDYNDTLMAYEYVTSDGTMVHNHEFAVDLLEFAVSKGGEVVDDLTPGTVLGVIHDKDGEPVVGAIIKKDDRTWATTDSSGAFEFKIAPGSYNLEVYEGTKLKHEFSVVSPEDGGTNDVGTVSYEGGGGGNTSLTIIGLVIIGIVLAVVFIALLLGKKGE